MFSICSLNHDIDDMFKILEVKHYLVYGDVSGKQHAISESTRSRPHPECSPPGRGFRDGAAVREEPPHGLSPQLDPLPAI